MLTAVAFGAGSAQAGMIDKVGMQPWEICGLCHGLDGISRMPKFPRLAGQRAAYIEKQLRDFRAGRRHNDGGQMKAIVTEISEHEIPVVAAHFSRSAPPEPVEPDVDLKALERARELFETGDAGAGVPACKGCHTASPSSPAAGPRISAQHPAYLAKQLHDFRAGERANDETGSMPQIAGKLTDADIDALAAFIAALPRERM